MEDGLQFIIMVLILALVAVFTWVRKSIEKLQAGKEGEKLDVGQSVRDQIRRYMKAAGYGQPPAGQPPIGIGGVVTQEEPPPPPVVRAAEMTGPEMTGPEVTGPEMTGPEVTGPPTPFRKPLTQPRPPVMERPRPARGEKLRPIRRLAPVKIKHRVRLTIGLGPEKVKEAIVLAELLGPPVGERSDYRLF